MERMAVAEKGGLGDLLVVAEREGIAEAVEESEGLKELLEVTLCVNEREGLVLAEMVFEPLGLAWGELEAGTDWETLEHILCKPERERVAEAQPEVEGLALGDGVEDAQPVVLELAVCEGVMEGTGQVLAVAVRVYEGVPLKKAEPLTEMVGFEGGEGPGVEFVEALGFMLDVPKREVVAEAPCVSVGALELEEEGYVVCEAQRVPKTVKEDVILGDAV